MSKFNVGEVVIYQNGDTFMIGVIKSVRPDCVSYFVNYHTGDTASLTNEVHLHKILNAYAFKIIRKNTEEA